MVNTQSVSILSSVSPFMFSVGFLIQNSDLGGGLNVHRKNVTLNPEPLNAYNNSYAGSRKSSTFCMLLVSM
jgi:hypothetical protein